MENISAVGRLLSKIKWEAASQQLEQKVRFGWRFPTDSNRIKNEHRLERRLLKEVRTVALPRMRGGLQTITFLAAAFPVGSGKRGQIDLLGISNAGGVCVVELKHGSNDPWWAVIEAAEYLLRLRTNYDRITKWMKDQCGETIGEPKFSRGFVVLPRGLFRKKSKECRLALALSNALRRNKMSLDIELHEMDYEGYNRSRLPQAHRLTIWERVR